MDKVRKKRPLNYSRRHFGEICPPEKRVRTYIPSEPTHGMSGGRDVRDYRVENPRRDERRHGFAYESTKRVHID